MPEYAAGGLTPEQAITWKHPYDPQMSPNGERVAFVLRDVSSSDEYPHSSIWMAGTASDKVRQFTYGPREDKDPRWSPDGETLAFVSDRADAGKPRLYLLSTHGGEAAQIPWNGETSDPRWSPDGRFLAFLSKEPETPEDKERIEKRRDHIAADRDYKFTYLYIVPAAGGDARMVGAEGSNNVWAYAWLPDNSGLVALVTDTPRVNDVSYGPGALIEYPLEGEPRTILHQDVGMSRPEVSPDGTQVAFLAKAGRVSAHDSIWLAPRQGGEPQCLTHDFKGSIETIVWSPDGRELRFVAYQGFWGMIGALDVASGEIRDLLLTDQQQQGSFDDSLSFDRTGSTFAVVRSASDSPPNVFAGTLDQGVRQITHLNEHLSEARYTRGAVIEWPSGDGLTIQGMLYRPLDWQEGQRCPLVVEIHGGPAWLWSDRFLGNWHDWAQLLVARGFAVLCPNPRGSTGRGHRFTDGEVNDMGGMELTDILCGVDHVLGMGMIDERRMAIAGWSHGGYLASWAITQTDRFRAAVVGAGVSNMLSDQGQNDIPGFNANYFDTSVYRESEGFWQRSPLAHVHKVKTPTLILHGEKDDRVTQPQGQELYRALQGTGVEVEFVTYPREGHSFKEREHQLDLMQRLLDWLDRHLGD